LQPSFNCKITVDYRKELIDNDHNETQTTGITEMQKFEKFTTNELKVLLSAMDAIHFTDNAANKLHKKLQREMLAVFNNRMD
jgi:hypothetical protein